MLSKLQKRPLVIFALVYCFGLFVSSKSSAPFLLFYVLALIFLFFCRLSFKKRVRFGIFLCCLIFFCAASLWKDYHLFPKGHIFTYRSYKNKPLYTVKGIVNSQPFFKNNILSFILKAEEIRFSNARHNTCGNILIRLRCKEDLVRTCKNLRGLRYGEELVVSGNLYRPFKYNAPHRQSYRDYLYNQGIFSVMNVRTVNSFARLNENRGLASRRLAFWLKARIERIIFKHISFLPASIVDAMVLGEKRNIPALINNAMMKSGTIHILVVSGFNVALVTFIIILTLQLARIPRKVRFFIAAFSVIIYCLMTGASTPVVRSTIMAIALMFAYLIKREADIYNTLALAALFILVTNPRQLFDVGFQLSFASVASIVYFYPRLKSFFPQGVLKLKYIRILAEGCLVSLAAWLGTAGLIAYYFRIVSTVTVVANILIVPLASLITLCGFTLLLMDSFCPPLAPLFAYSIEFVVMLVLRTNAFLIKLPCAYFYLP